MEYFASPKNQKSDEVTGISRSGRVRKKSSKLVDFESPDDFMEQKLKKQKTQHAQQILEKYEQQLQHPKLQNVNNIQQTNSIHQTNSFHQRNNFDQNVVQYKQENNNDSTSENEGESSDSESGSVNGIENDDRFSSESVTDDDIDPLMMEEVETEETTGFTKLEPPEQSELPSRAKSSLYMLEKYKKKLVIKDGKVINKSIKAQRKDKGKTRFTAYMLWAKDVRQQLVEQDPNLDFATISKRLGALWATVPSLEKYNWWKRAKRLALKPSETIGDSKMPPPISRKFINKIAIRDASSPKKTIQLGTVVVGNKVPVSPPSNKVGKDVANESFLGTGMYKVTGTQPIDIAAHLTLLGENLTIIGKRLKEHEGQITVSGSLPLLLDSLLCAIGPLLCLTQQIPEMNGANSENLSTILENVAYIMPGL
ncbi:PREDICTED: HMG box-containing protein 4-like isoform X2 [Ceratosolen solmsi marchali]|uniref:HMG box-containing protein 4-like isoform X2 n=1 Tax=Ceratosolen solmsi marchali TaxID=326594 RepID=A0AAJ6YNN5_9HYME|nr:PREDICTED: HMG box-containing protein 4-like isoform X2 [Ceratosolen solmsi marchali]